MLCSFPARGCALVLVFTGLGSAQQAQENSRERKRKRLIFGQKVILLLCLLTLKPPIQSGLIQEKA
jgi:hypothetical protein